MAELDRARGLADLARLRVSGEVASNAVEVYVSRLRKLLAEYGARIAIHTMRGVGYLMAEEK